MPTMDVLESVSEQDGGWLDTLSGGFNSLMDGVVQYGQLSIQERMREQFPEQFPPQNTTQVPVENAIGENALSAPKKQIMGIDSNILMYGGIGLGVLALGVMIFRR